MGAARRVRRPTRGEGCHDQAVLACGLGGVQRLIRRDECLLPRLMHIHSDRADTQRHRHGREVAELAGGAFQKRPEFLFRLVVRRADQQQEFLTAPAGRGSEVLEAGREFQKCPVSFRVTVPVRCSTPRRRRRRALIFDMSKPAPW